MCERPQGIARWRMCSCIGELGFVTVLFCGKLVSPTGLLTPFVLATPLSGIVCSKTVTSVFVPGLRVPRGEVLCSMLPQELSLCGPTPQEIVDPVRWGAFVQ